MGLLVILIMGCHAALATVFAPATVPFHFDHGFAVIVPVTINGSGPYPFLLDTGATITALDRELAQELTLDSAGAGTVTTIVERLPVSLAMARTVSVGPMTAERVEIMVRDLKGLRAMAPSIRGVLGQNALSRADFLLDYRHRRLEFDTDGSLLAALGGNHVPLRHATLGDNPQYSNLAVHANIEGGRTVDFLLDSGAATMVLFDKPETMPQGFVRDTAGMEHAAALRSQRLQIGDRMKEVQAQVVAFTGVEPNIHGLLPTDIFNRLYISNTGSFAIFEPKDKKRSGLDGMVARMSGGDPVAAQAAMSETEAVTGESSN